MSGGLGLMISNLNVKNISLSISVKLRVTNFKVEYHANENPLKNSEKHGMCWSKVNVSNNNKNKYKKTPYHASRSLNAITCLGFYIKNSSF